MNKNHLISLVSILLFTVTVHPQQEDSLALKDSSLNQIPQKVYRYCYVIETKDWYKNQERLWRTETINDPQNEDAWYNYFFAARYGWADIQGQTNTREELMDSIYQEMGNAIPDSWVYHYIHYYNYATDFSRLERAYQLNPDAPDLYWEFIKEYTLNGQKEKRKEFCKKLYISQDISTGIYNLCYNMLNSAGQNAILFTNGDTDTYPSWVLQESKGIRIDVLILTIHGTFYNRDYLKSILADKGIHLEIDTLSQTNVALYLKELIQLLKEKYPEVPVHLAQSVYELYYEDLKDKLYLTGLVLTYSDAPLNDDELNKEIIENKLRLDYLDFDWYADLHVSEPLVNELNLIYVDPFIKLGKYYYLSGDISSARKWKNKALSISIDANDEDLIRKIEEWKW